ncbi:AbiJ-NTD4 domain-containing protein [Rhodospirillum rubrum]|uniref:AbiJ-NTD4 domain-containing protein n=1 Tax=Rhodospirillum rubrum TaxID=1085 RepID=UPI0011D2A0FD|nr:hypothetical protein [Rhodospirillum rubrum]QXG80053.1 hypothetical protein KUL73_17125 [Rhodospirillum rubrum]
MKFSEINGFSQKRLELQIDSMDCALRNALWNVLFLYLFNNPYRYNSTVYLKTDFNSALWIYFFKERIDEFPSNVEFVQYVKNSLLHGEFYLFYDLIDFVLEGGYFCKGSDLFIGACNKALKKEMSGWRIVGQKITKITSEEEIDCVNSSIEAFPKDPVAIHLQTAIGFLSDRESPDYRNSMKESISAVESVCRCISGKKTFQSALNEIQNMGIIRHSALRDGLNKIYAYTSDENGVRHNLTDNPNVDFDDAKFMLVMCSAFINFIRAHQPT